VTINIYAMHLLNFRFIRDIVLSLEAFRLIRDIALNLEALSRRFTPGRKTLMAESEFLLLFNRSFLWVTRNAVDYTTKVETFAQKSQQLLFSLPTSFENVPANVLFGRSGRGPGPSGTRAQPAASSEWRKGGDAYGTDAI